MPPVAPRGELRKEAAMAVHLRGYQSFGAMQSRGLSQTSFSIADRPSCAPSRPLPGLRPISLSELQVGKVHRGRVLFGTLCADAFMITAVVSVLQDQTEPSLAVRVGIYNAAPSTASLASVQGLYPNGTRVAVKEPYLKRALDGVLALRVNNPADIEKVISENNVQQQSGKRVSENDVQQQSSDVDDDDLNAAFRLKQEGNIWFAREDWVRARDCYTKCISLIMQKKELGKKDTSLVLAAYSNRGEAYLRLGSHEEALDDCKQALAVDPCHVKSHYRRARALYNLSRFHEASSCLQALLSDHPELHEVRSFLDKVKHSLENNPTQKLAMSDFLLGKGPPPKLQEYVGPVVVRMTEDGRGRGLFATADVHPGDLLLVSNAVAFSVQDLHKMQLRLDFQTNRVNVAGQEDLVTELVKKGMESPGFLQQLYNLASSNNVGTELPSMYMFTNFASSVVAMNEHGSSFQVDIERIREIVRINAFAEESSLMVQHHHSGIWLLPSFMNHSCIPNATRLHVGKALVIHASSEIHAGEEITISYFNPLLPLEYRRENAEGWNFRCACKRCWIEESVESHLQGINKHFFAVFHAAAEEYGSSPTQLIELWSNAKVVDACRELSKIYKRAHNVISSFDNLTNLERKYILASYSTAFWAQWFQDWTAKDASLLEDSIGTAVELMEAVRASVQGCEWNLAFVVKLATLSQRFGLKGVNDGYLTKQAKEECISTFGNQKPEMIEELTMKYLDTVPIVFIT